MLDQLRIIHIYNYIKESGTINPIDMFIKETTPIILSTCMRHIYLFQNEQVGIENKCQLLVSSLQNAPNERKCAFDDLQGSEAYAFLLYWSISALHPKIPFADDRLLGQLRNSIGSYSKTTSKKKADSYSINQKILNALLVDAKNIHKLLIEHHDISLEEKKGLFKTICANCSFARGNGFLDNIHTLDYSIFRDKDVMVIELEKYLNDTEEKCNKDLKKISEQRINLSLFSPITYITKKVESIDNLRAFLRTSTESISTASL